MQAEHGARPGRHQTQQHEDLAIAVDTSAANEDQPRTRNLFIAFTHSKDALWAALGFVAVLPFSFVMCMQMCSDSSVDVEGSTAADNADASGVVLTSRELRADGQWNGERSEQEAIWGSRALYGQDLRSARRA